MEFASFAERLGVKIDRPPWLGGAAGDDGSMVFATSGQMPQPTPGRSSRC